jgi:hypothetical protein
LGQLSPKSQAPVTRADFDARCLQLYPNLFRTAADSKPSPPPAGWAPPAHVPGIWGSPRTGTSDFNREGIPYIIASLALGISSFLLPLLVGNIFTCDGINCCRCAGPKATFAMLCQAVGWAAFIYFCGIGSAIEWTSTISCGCSKPVPSPVGALPLAANATSSTTSTDSSADNGQGSCQSLDHAMLPSSFLVSHGALGVVATSCAVIFLLLVSAPQRRYTESQRRMAAARAGELGGMSAGGHAVQLNPLARHSLAPIITAEPWSPDQGPVCVVGIPLEEGGTPNAVGVPAGREVVAQSIGVVAMAIGIPVQPQDRRSSG